MGSRSKTNLAYIAGFLDGDGSLMLQIKKRKDGKSKLRFMPTICFYQDTRHAKTLHWIRRVLNIGYPSARRDGITELRVNGFQQVRDILHDLLPFIRFKKTQAVALHTAARILSNNAFKTLDNKTLKTLVDLILVIQDANYVTKRKKTRTEFYKVLGLTP